MSDIAGEIPVSVLKRQKTELLLAWYETHKRTLPWRDDPSPYHVWLSEIMLQQTRVEAVKAYYARFIREIPDIAALAAAPEEAVLKLWEGLGYYSRIRNMQRAAKIVTERYGGQMPRHFEELRALPGIGDYTAGAIASIACGQQEAAVDGNVLRVWMRSEADPRDIAEERTKKALRGELAAYLPEAARCGAFNQALMDLGATVCLPNGAPLCTVREAAALSDTVVEGGDAKATILSDTAICPWARLCKAHLAGRELDFPVKRPKKPRRIERRTVLLLQDGYRTAIRKRAAKGLLAGLYEFINLEGWLSEDALRVFLKESGVQAVRIRRLPEAKHIFTHIEWHMQGFAVRVDELSQFRPEAFDCIMADTDALKERYPLPSAFKAYFPYIRQHGRYS